MKSKVALKEISAQYRRAAKAFTASLLAIDEYGRDANSSELTTAAFRGLMIVGEINETLREAKN